MKKEKSSRTADQTQVEKAFAEFFNQKIVLTLVKYAILRLKFKFKYHYDENKGIDGKTIEDLIYETNVSFLDKGRRSWYIDTYPDFKDQYKSAFNSVLSNEMEKLLRKPRISCFEDTIEIEEKDDHFEETWKSLQVELTRLGADDFEILYFESAYIDQLKRNQIAQEMGISQREVTDIKRRLDRKLIQLRKYWDPD